MVELVLRLLVLVDETMVGDCRVVVGVVVESCRKKGAFPLLFCNKTRENPHKAQSTKEAEAVRAQCSTRSSGSSYELHPPHSTGVVSGKHKVMVLSNKLKEALPTRDGLSRWNSAQMDSTTRLLVE
jgi:hypothetical protein